jgi:hypothetical protein
MAACHRAVTTGSVEQALAARKSREGQRAHEIRRARSTNFGPSTPWPLAEQCEIDRVAALKPSGQMNKQTVALIALFAGLILRADIANATAYEDIAGQWCGDVTDYVFTPDTLTVKFHDNRPANVFKITKYTYTNDSVRINWLNGADELVMVFAEFSGNKTAMAQQENEDKPRRAFHRC